LHSPFFGFWAAQQFLLNIFLAPGLTEYEANGNLSTVAYNQKVNRLEVSISLEVKPQPGEALYWTRFEPMASQKRISSTNHWTTMVDHKEFNDAVSNTEIIKR
jgi:hypothetical protein